MSYEHRFGCTSKRPNDFRHDPAHHGICVHGGTCCAGTFFRSHGANRFMLTLPCSNKAGKEIRIEGQYKWPVHPTFQKAVEFAVEIRNGHPDLKDCPILACTDLHQDTTFSGKYEMQLVLS
jgi:hypothetical protein